MMCSWYVFFIIVNNKCEWTVVLNTISLLRITFYIYSSSENIVEECNPVTVTDNYMFNIWLNAEFLYVLFT